jgi:hypothetical protein
MKSLISVKWKSGSKWLPFQLSDILHMSRDHAIALFSNPPIVVAKDGETYITNRESIRDDYKKQNKPCILFSDLQPSTMPLEEVGLI